MGDNLIPSVGEISIADPDSTFLINAMDYSACYAIGREGESVLCIALHFNMSPVNELDEGQKATLVFPLTEFPTVRECLFAGKRFAQSMKQARAPRRDTGG